jgi:hypothetical protein
MIRWIRHRYKRFLVKWRRWKQKIEPIDNNITLRTFEEKSIRLWRYCLKDDETQLTYNSSGIRQIEKDDILMILKPNTDYHYLMTIMHVNDDKKNLYEIHIPNKQATYVCDLFDWEMDKRMGNAENSKKLIIESDIDKLLEQQENILRKKKKISFPKKSK